MREITTKIYEFSELSEEAKQKAIDYFREHEDFPFLSDDLAEKLAELLKKHGIKYDTLPKVYYSLSYCQGDGAMFEGIVYWKAWEVAVKHSGMYYHYNSKSFSLTSRKTGELAPSDRDEAFNEVYVEICRELERYGYDVIESQLTDEAITETIEANEYEFTADGKLA